jgi:hypothetical protein
MISTPEQGETEPQAGTGHGGPGGAGDLAITSPTGRTVPAYASPLS